jgi:hypothetical protein
VTRLAILTYCCLRAIYRLLFSTVKVVAFILIKNELDCILDDFFTYLVKLFGRYALSGPKCLGPYSYQI